MRSSAARNSVLFNQLRENGFKCTWTGLNQIAVHELVTVCKSDEDVSTFQEGFELLFQGKTTIIFSITHLRQQLRF